MPEPESWKSVAIRLAGRLEHQPHPCHEPTWDACGYCQDALAYQRFVARLAADGQAVRDPLADAVAVPIQDVATTSGAHANQRSAG